MSRLGLFGGGADVAATAVTAGGFITSYVIDRRARRDLSRAIWWYNAGLPR